MKTDLVEFGNRNAETSVEISVVVDERMALIISDQSNNGCEFEGFSKTIAIVGVIDFDEFVIAILPTIINNR